MDERPARTWLSTAGCDGRRWAMAHLRKVSVPGPRCGRGVPRALRDFLVFKKKKQGCIVHDTWTPTARRDSASAAFRYIFLFLLLMAPHARQASTSKRHTVLDKWNFRYAPYKQKRINVLRLSRFFFRFINVIVSPREMTGRKNARLKKGYTTRWCGALFIYE